MFIAPREFLRRAVECAVDQYLCFIRSALNCFTLRIGLQLFDGTVDGRYEQQYGHRNKKKRSPQQISRRINKVFMQFQKSSHSLELQVENVAKQKEESYSTQKTQSKLAIS